MTYVYNFDQPPQVDHDDSLQLLGGKGHNLAMMRTDLGLPVPPGFTLTTEAGREFLARGWPGDLEEQIRVQMQRVEDEVGRRFGGPGEPLLVSVRSGAAVSMPGMMDTVLNLGLNDANVDDLAAACGDPVFATESLARLTTMYRHIVGVADVPSDPWAQLRGAIEAVFRSWNSDRARAYRDREGIPDDLGTAVTVQAMVFGNLDDDSGTGVLFTRNPANGARHVFGDVLFRAQGEDVVAGTHETEDIEVLAERLPQVYDELESHSDTLEKHFRDVCDIEFTIERGRLWLLQVRVGKRSPQAALRFAVDMATDEEFPLSRTEAIERVKAHLANPPVTVSPIDASIPRLATGLPASPGVAIGRIATTADDAVEMAENGDDVVLVRPETSPDDVHGMARVRGILTSTGGLASHAAVVARGWGLPAVVGATEVVVAGDRVRVAVHELSIGDVVTLNGHTGEVFAGPVEVQTIVPEEVAILTGWATELNVDIEVSDDGPMTGDAHGHGEEVDVETVLRAMHIKGFATPESLAPVVLSTEEQVAPILERMAADGLVKPMGPMVQLTESARAIAADLMEADRESWSVVAAETALDAFLPLDGRMKTTVTAWQMRVVDGEQILNDHTDESYDRGVLDDFAAIHTDATEWLEPLEDGLARLSVYRRRLERAAARVAAGDHDYIASPRIDSYHNVWFELHEDLIQLAGRTREDETREGRA